MNTAEQLPSHQDTPLPARRKYPAILHFSILAVVLLPLGLTPYILSCRNTRALYTQIEHLTSLNSSLSHELRSLHVENTTRRDTIRQLSRSIEQIQANLDKLKACDEEMTLKQTSVAQSVQGKLLALDRRITAQDTAVRSLATTFADVAAFMEENKLETGDVDVRVDRLRTTALRVGEAPPSTELPHVISKK